MAAPTESAENNLIVSRSAAYDRFHRAMMMFVGRGKRHGVADVAKGTGISASVLYGWLAGPESQDWRHPHAGHLLSLCGFIGPEFTTELLQPISQGAFWLPDVDTVPPGELAADLSEATADVTRRAADGEFCSNDRRALGSRGRHLMVVGAQLVQAATA